MWVRTLYVTCLGDKKNHLWCRERKIIYIWWWSLLWCLWFSLHRQFSPVTVSVSERIHPGIMSWQRHRLIQGGAALSLLLKFFKCIDTILNLHLKRGMSPHLFVKEWMYISWFGRLPIFCSGMRVGRDNLCAATQLCSIVGLCWSF